MERLKTVLDLYLKYNGALGCGLVTVLTAGVERIFSAVVFQCPCSATWNLAYGLVFLLVPAVVLFLLGYLLSARTWRLLTGCCAPGSCTCCGGRGQRGILVFAQLSSKAAIAPLTWLAVALLGGNFYECAASGSEVLARRLCSGRDSSCTALLPLVSCGNEQAATVMDLQKDLRAQSQVAGWILIAAVIIFLVIFVFVTRCLSPVSFMQLNFWKIYSEQEQKIFKSEATEHATKLAENNVKCFFDSSYPKGENKTPSVEAWKKISSVYTFSPKGQYYSMLDKYVNREEKSSSVKHSEENVVPALSFVDSQDIHITSGL